MKPNEKHILTSVDGSETFRYHKGDFTDSLIKSVLFRRYTVFPLVSAMNSYPLHWHICDQKHDKIPTFIERAIIKGWARPTFHEPLNLKKNHADEILQYLKELYLSDKSALPKDIQELVHYPRFLDCISENIASGSAEYMTQKGQNTSESARCFLEHVETYLKPEGDIKSLMEEHPESKEEIVRVLLETKEVFQKGFLNAKGLMKNPGLSRGLLIGEIGVQLGHKDETTYAHIDAILKNMDKQHQEYKNAYSTLFKWINRAHHFSSAKVLYMGASLPKFRYSENLETSKESSPIRKVRINPLQFSQQKDKMRPVLMPHRFETGMFDNTMLFEARETKGENYFEALDAYGMEPNNPKAVENLYEKFNEYVQEINKAVNIRLFPTWPIHPYNYAIGPLLDFVSTVSDAKEIAGENGMLPLEISFGASALDVLIFAFQTMENKQRVGRGHYTLNLSSTYFQDGIGIY